MDDLNALHFESEAFDILDSIARSASTHTGLIKETYIEPATKLSNDFNCNCSEYEIDDVFAYCKECGKTIPNDIILNQYNVNCFTLPRKKYSYSRNDMFVDNLFIFIGQLSPVLKKKNKEIYNLNTFISTLNKDDPLHVKKEIVKFVKENNYNFLNKYINYFFIESIKHLHNEFIIKIESKDVLLLKDIFSEKTKNVKNIIFSKVIYSLLKDYGYNKVVLTILLYPKHEVKIE